MSRVPAPKRIGYDVEMRARLLPLLIGLTFLACHKGGQPAQPPIETDGGRSGHAIQTVFVILMENHNWADVFGSTSAPYLNQTLLPRASYARHYFNPPGLHPSEPNYLWLEAGSNLGVNDDSDPIAHHFSTDQHLVALLKKAGISWKAYQEDIPGTDCPLRGVNLYAPKHNPFVYFDDVTGANDPSSAECIVHVRPYGELARDLDADTVAAYNFITPNLCNDMHNVSGCPTGDAVKNGDDWLSREVPKLLASKAYQRGGALFITWDEGEGSDGPIGMIVLSPFAKGGGYANDLSYTHSSTLRTFQEIFAVGPALGDAAHATDLSDLFRQFP